MFKSILKNHEIILDIIGFIIGFGCIFYAMLLVPESDPSATYYLLLGLWLAGVIGGERVK